MPSTLLVTGAAGKLGQRVIAHLLDTHKVPPNKIIAGTRNPDQLASLGAKGIQVRKLDFEDASTFTSALAGVDRMLLISTDAVGRPGRRLAQHKAAVEAARKAGVKHIVYTSMPNPETSLVLFAPDHLGTEQALTASGLGWTILRMNWYMENLFTSVPSALATGKWFTATGNGRVGYVSREDCARVAAASVAAESNVNSRYDVTGPDSVSVEQIAALVSTIVGKPLEVVHVNDDQLKQGLIAAGIAEFVAPLVVSIDANTRAGKLDIVSNTVEKLTGKPPQQLQPFLAENSKALLH